MGRANQELVCDVERVGPTERGDEIYGCNDEYEREPEGNVSRSCRYLDVAFLNVKWLLRVVCGRLWAFGRGRVFVDSMSSGFFESPETYGWVLQRHDKVVEVEEGDVGGVSE